jgi:hypothetical protein
MEVDWPSELLVCSARACVRACVCGHVVIRQERVCTDILCLHMYVRARYGPIRSCHAWVMRVVRVPCATCVRNVLWCAMSSRGGGRSE